MVYGISGSQFTIAITRHEVSKGQLIRRPAGVGGGDNDTRPFGVQSSDNGR